MAKWKNKILNWAEQDEDGKKELERWLVNFRWLINEGIVVEEELLDWDAEGKEPYHIMEEIRSKAINYPVYWEEIMDARVEYFMALKNSNEGMKLIEARRSKILEEHNDSKD
jgi:hypothetical protein